MKDKAREEIARRLCELDGWNWEELDEVHRHFFVARTRSDYYKQADRILSGKSRRPEFASLLYLE